MEVLQQINETVVEHMSKPPPLISNCVNGADTAWVLISTVLILGMMPGLALFEAGLIRAKNTISILVQVFAGMIVLSVIWHVVGFSFVFGTDLGGFIGNPFDYIVLLNLPYDSCFPGQTIPAAAYAVFQMMFASITPLLMTGAVAERLKFKCFFILCLVWEFVVYFPLAHWMWGTGGWLKNLGAVDFAGGIVIHTSAGAGALVLSKMLGRRKGYETCHGEFPPSNLPLAGTGAALLWIGWFGFNAGSALSSGHISTSTVASTQVAGTVSGLTWLMIAWYRGHKAPSFVSIINGVIAGLAGITPASGYIESAPTLAVGFILGVASYFSCIIMKQKLWIDDALDVSSVHGLTGIIGSLSIGFLATQDANPNGPNGAFYGNPKQIWIQLVAVAVAFVYAAFWTYVIGYVLNKTIGLRIDEEEENKGLDTIEHQESPYDFDSRPIHGHGHGHGHEEDPEIAHGHIHSINGGEKDDDILLGDNSDEDTSHKD